MAYSLGLTLYNLSGRRDLAAGADRPPRPAGPLVWLHAPSAEPARALLELARRQIAPTGQVVKREAEGIGHLHE
jgi:3-deoxy-D-manno-octulosonic-acid transferase